MSARCVASQPRDLATMWVGSAMLRSLRLPAGDGVLPLVLGHPIRDHGLGFTVGHITIELDRDKQTATKIMVGNPRPNGTLDCCPHMIVKCARLERIEVSGHAGAENEPAEREGDRKSTRLNSSH